MAWARDRDSDDDEQEGSSRRQHRAFQPPRVSFRRTRPIRNQYLQGFVFDFEELYYTKANKLKYFYTSYIDFKTLTKNNPFYLQIKTSYMNSKSLNKIE